jgi:Na+/H+ antiporter NhaB
MTGSSSIRPALMGQMEVLMLFLVMRAGLYRSISPLLFQWFEMLLLTFDWR